MEGRKRRGQVLVAAFSTMVFNLVAGFTVWAWWDSAGMRGSVESWVPFADRVLGFPVRTVDAWLTHGNGAFITLDGRVFNLFLWEFPINAAIWGLVAGMIAQRLGRRVESRQAESAVKP